MVAAPGVAPSGDLSFVDQKSKVTAKTKSFTNMSCTNTTATLYGTALVKTDRVASTKSFVLNVTDGGGKRGTGDSFDLSFSGGYSTTGSLIRGDLIVRKSS